MKSKRAKACDISPKTKQIVWDRDGQRCIFCGSPYAMPNAHVVSRGKLGLGIEQNVVTACLNCHRKMDQTIHRKEMLEKANKYLDAIYGERNTEDLVYKNF